jgi:hypothetical protein
MSLLNDGQLAGVAETAYLWGNVPFNPDSAIGKAWLAQLKAGSFRGKPVSGEVNIPSVAGAVFQVFEQGVAVYVPGQDVSWQG